MNLRARLVCSSPEFLKDPHDCRALRKLGGGELAASLSPEGQAMATAHLMLASRYHFPETPRTCPTRSQAFLGPRPHLLLLSLHTLLCGPGASTPPSPQILAFPSKYPSYCTR